MIACRFVVREVIRADDHVGANVPILCWSSHEGVIQHRFRKIIFAVVVLVVPIGVDQRKWLDPFVDAIALHDRKGFIALLRSRFLWFEVDFFFTPSLASVTGFAEGIICIEFPSPSPTTRFDWNELFFPACFGGSAGFFSPFDCDFLLLPSWFTFAVLSSSNLGFFFNSALEDFTGLSVAKAVSPFLDCDLVCAFMISLLFFVVFVRLVSFLTSSATSWSTFPFFAKTFFGFFGGFSSLSSSSGSSSSSLPSSNM